MKLLITGCAGFIGFHLAQKLLSEKNQVVGVDTVNNYYDPRLKLARVKLLKKNRYFNFKKIDISDQKELNKIFKKYKFDQVINLAAFAGVEYSLKHPEKYINTNEIGFFNILEAVKKYKIPKLLYASSSTVYGLNKLPFDETQRTDGPISLYGATKKNNEILAYYYSSQFNIETFGIRFFTVYGPYGRPDLSIFKFCRQIIKNETVTLHNYGNNYRDFTYIADVVDSLLKIIKIKKKKFNKKYKCFYNLINIASGRKIKMTKLLKLIEKNIGKKAKVKLGKKLSTDIPASLSYSRVLRNTIKVKTKTSIEDGIKFFVDWYLSYYKSK